MSVEDLTTLGELCRAAAELAAAGAPAQRIIWRGQMVDNSTNLTVAQLAAIAPIAIALDAFIARAVKRGCEAERVAVHERMTEELADELERLQRRLARNQVPRLTLKNIPRYIAAVAAQTEAGAIEGKAASAMLYAAQLMIGASRVGALDPQDRPPPKKPNGSADLRQLPPAAPTIDG